MILRIFSCGNTLCVYISESVSTCTCSNPCCESDVCLCPDYANVPRI